MRMYLSIKDSGQRRFFSLLEGIEKEYATVDPYKVGARLFKKRDGEYVLTRVNADGERDIYEIYEVREMPNDHVDSVEISPGLNMTHLRMTEKWAKEKRTFNITDISAAVAHVAVNLSDGFLPHSFDQVLTAFTNSLIDYHRTYCVGNVYMIDATLDEIVGVAYDFLVRNKSFREWNLTSLEMQCGVDVDDDKQRTKACLFEKSDKKFIDLDAFRQNLYCVLRSDLIEEYFFEGNLDS